MRRRDFIRTGIAVASATFCGKDLAFTATPGTGEDTRQLLPVPKDLTSDVPRDFPRFFFPQHDTEAGLLSRYLWNHFSNRGGYGKVAFNKEYLTTSDMWLGGGVHPGWPGPIQEIHRDELLSIRQDREGYIWTHQHFSHAHEQGWPFPMWTQAPSGPEGYTVGWHFQDDGPGWVWDKLRREPHSPFCRAQAIEDWELVNVRSLGIQDKKWQLEASGPSPAITTPRTVSIDALNAPFLQLRWLRTPAPGKGASPYVEWMREEDSEFSPERRVYFGFDTGDPDHEKVSGVTHSMIEMYRHPMWKGRVKVIRLSLAPGESAVKFSLDSFFTTYDTRHTINNPIYILSCWEYFRWTGEIEFLGAVIDRMRLALRYQQTVMGGLKYNRIRDTWAGHDGLPGFTVERDGKKKLQYGHGIGSNYWDLLPIGWDDMYATSQYYASLGTMAEVEEAIAAHPGWDVSKGALALDPAELRSHATAVKNTANEIFWNDKTGRFVACIDQDGRAHDYGFTFLNLDAIWYGIASDAHAKLIMDWLGGKRVVDGDTSTGADIYHWRFGPRATTKRNLDWYGQGWTEPERIPWGGQVQDGGAVLGFAFYDYWACLRVLGPERAWQRLTDMLSWEKEVWAEGGYRKYYENGRHGSTLQGCGTAGGIGVDCEFWESSLIPSIVIHGFLGLNPGATGLRIRPQLPDSCPEMGVSNVLYRGVRLDIKASGKAIDVALKDQPRDPILLQLEGQWKSKDTGEARREFALTAPGIYQFRL